MVLERFLLPPDRESGIYTVSKDNLYVLWYILPNGITIRDAAAECGVLTATLQNKGACAGSGTSAELSPLHRRYLLTNGAGGIGYHSQDGVKVLPPSSLRVGKIDTQW